MSPEFWLFSCHFVIVGLLPPQWSYVFCCCLIIIRFISWLKANKPSYSPLASLGEDGTGKIEFVFGNSTQQTLKYTFKFMALENVEVLGQNPIQVVLEPGKRTFKPMLRVTKSPFSVLALQTLLKFVFDQLCAFFPLKMPKWSDQRIWNPTRTECR